MTVDHLPSFADLMAPDGHDARVSRVVDAGLSDDDGLTWLLAQAEDVLHAAPVTAEAALHVVVERGAALGLHRLEGHSHYLLARILAERGDLDAALYRIARARDRFHTATAPLPMARTDLGRMQILDDLGRHAEAAAVGEALLELLPSLPVAGADDVRVRKLVTAAAWGNCGVAYGYLGQHHRSLDAYERAEQGYAELGMESESAQWQANRGVELLNLGAAEDAAEALTAAAQGFQEAGDLVWFAKCQGDLAQADQLNGDLVGALARLDQAHLLLERLGADAEAARVMIQRAQVYLDAGLWRESRNASTGAAEIARSAGMLHDQAHAHFLAARASVAGGSLSEGERELSGARTLFDEVGDQQFVARADLVTAEILLERGHTPEGLALMEETVGRLRTGGWRIPAAWGLIALHDASAGREDTAWLDAAERLTNETGHPQLAAAVRLRRARTLRACGSPDDATGVLRQAVATLEDLGTALAEPLLATAASASTRPVYDELVHLLVSRGTADALAEALVVSDRAKTRALQDLIGRTVGRAGIQHPHRTHDRAAEVASYRRRLSAVYAAIHEATDPARTAPLRERAREMEAELGDLLVRSHASNARSEAAVVRRAASEPRVEGRRPGIAFHVAGSDVVALRVDDFAVSGVVLRGAYDRARALVGQLSSQWGRFRMLGRFDLHRHDEQLLATTRSVLAELYDVLLRPLDLPVLEGADLVITPDRLLHRIPFHALHDGSRYLLERHPVVLSPTSLPQRIAPARDPARLLVVGVPDDRAPHIAEEVARITSGAGSLTLLGEEATVAAVTAASRAATHLHLACHGMYREENPLFSSLRFADRWATVCELLELDLAGKAITLSACESGRTDDSADPVGMAWGFLAAGADSVVVSQWVLDDESSVEVMAGYHAGLRGGRPPAVALRDAQLTQMQQRPHPYYWAPFVHVASPFAGGVPTEGGGA